MILLLPLAIYLAYKYPAPLNRSIYYSLKFLCVVTVGEAVLGCVMALTDWTTDAHRVLAHTIVITLWLIFSLSLPACIGHCIRSKNIFGFRQIPSGLLTMILTNFCTFTAYIKPDDPGHAGAYLRFVVFHYFLGSISMFLALFRWYFLMKEYNRGTQITGHIP